MVDILEHIRFVMYIHLISYIDLFINTWDYLLYLLNWITHFREVKSIPIKPLTIFKNNMYNCMPKNGKLKKKTRMVILLAHSHFV